MKEELLEKAGVKAMEMLEGLAAQLGVTIEQLWAVLVKQCYVDTVKHALMSLLPLSVFGFCVYVLLKFKNREDNKEFWYETPLGFITVVASIIAMGVFINELGHVAQVFNPEYFAYKEIAKLLH